jgi:hypothetical protein
MANPMVLVCEILKIQSNIGHHRNLKFDHFAQAWLGRLIRLLELLDWFQLFANGCGQTTDDHFHGFAR